MSSTTDRTGYVFTSNLNDYHPSTIVADDDRPSWLSDSMDLDTVDNQRQSFNQEVRST